ncbi:MAG: hypothetical protein IT381_30145 [Deltaproteobacteria bacterium]|nr:hypothetical protein [Deltaproteobacteria bacterium]
MRNGPWNDREAIREAIRTRNLPKSVTGKRPVAVESCGNDARFLYVVPDKEPLPMSAFPPFLQFYRDTRQ